VNRSGEDHWQGISPALPARIDFAAVLVMLLVSHALPLRPASVLLSMGLAGAGVLFGSATDYPYPFHGSRRLSFPTHRWGEVLSFPACLWLPARLGLLRFRLDRACFLTLFVPYLISRVLTDWSCATGSGEREVVSSLLRTPPS